MTARDRFIASIVNATQTTEVVMPWVRGPRRQAFIEKRAVEDTKPKKSA